MATQQGLGQPTLDSNGQIANIDLSALSNNNTAAGAVTSAGFDLGTVVNQLNNQVGAISSSANTIDQQINAAIESQRSAAAANEAAVTSQFGRESSYLSDKLQNERTALLEQSRGGAISGSGLMIVDKEIDKQLKDLEQRKNELILQGNAAAASKISDLQVQGLQFKLDTQQKIFTNMLGLGQFAQSIMDFQQRTAESARRQTMDQLNYNLNVRQQKALEAKNASDAAYQTAQINIMKRELIIKEAQAKKETDLAKLKGAPGWYNAEYQMNIMEKINPELLKISADPSMSESEKQAALALVYTKYRHQFSPDIVTDAALTEAIFGAAAVPQQSTASTNPFGEVFMPGNFSYSTNAIGTTKANYGSAASSIWDTMTNNWFTDLLSGKR